MSRPVEFPVVAGAVWLGVALLAILQSWGLAVFEGVTLCPVRWLTGYSCPGCGMGHSVVSAMRGDFPSAFRHHPLGIPVLFLWTSWLAWGILNLPRGREFSAGFLPALRRPAFVWGALAVALVVHAVRVV